MNWPFRFVPLATLLIASSAWAEPPKPPVVPDAAESAAKAEAAQKAAGNAEAAQKAAANAEAAQKASEAAEAAQKAAKNAEVAEKAARNAEAAQKAAKNAEVAEKAARNAEVAQRAAKNAEVAEKAARNAEVAQKAAKNAEVAEKAARNAEVAQKAAKNAEVAEKAARNAEVAQKAAKNAEVAEKAARNAEVAQKAANNAEVAEKTARNAEVAQKAANNAEVAEKAAANSEAAQKASQSAEVARKTSDAATKLAQDRGEQSPSVLKNPVTGRPLFLSRVSPERQPAKPAKPGTPAPTSDPLGGDAKRGASEISANRASTLSAAGKSSQPAQSQTKGKDTSPPSAPSNSRKALSPDELNAKQTAAPASAPRNPQEEKAAGKQAAKNLTIEDLKALALQAKQQAEAEVSENIQDTRTDLISSTGVSRDKARALAGKLAGGDEEAKATTTLVDRAGATLQLVGADQTKTQKVLEEIIDRRLTDASSGGTTDNLVGAVVIETLTGQKPNAQTPRLGEVARALIDAKSDLQLTGLEDTAVGKEVLSGIVQGGLRGEKAKGFVKSKIQPFIDAIASDPANQPAAGGSAPVAGANVGNVPAAVDRGAAGIGGQVAKAPVAVEVSAPAAGSQPAETATAPVASQAPVNAAVEAPAAVESAPEPVQNSQPAPGQQSVGTSAPAPGVSDSTSSHTTTFETDGPRLILTERDENGKVVETTIIIDMGDGRESVVVKDANGNVTDAYVQNGPQETVTTAQRGGGGETQESQPASTTESTPAAEGDQQEGEQGDSSTASASPTPPPAEEEGDEPAAPAETSDSQTAKDSTPNPEAADQGTGMELAEKTGGRLGGQEARNARRGLGLAASGGGAAGPTNPESTASSGVLLTPEEQKNFQRLLNMKTGGGVTNPSPLDEGSTAVTERDLRELGLRGNGGAKGPTENSGPPPPQDPGSPIAGSGPAPAPGPVSAAAKGIQSQISDSSVRIKANIQEVNPSR